MKTAQVLMLLVAACGVASCGAGATPSPTAAVTGPNQGTDLFGNSQVEVTAGVTGVSQSFVTTIGHYHIQYLIDAGARDNGCSFALTLRASKNGPILLSTVAIMPDSSEGAADVNWTMAGGSYLLQEDESGALDCRRGYQATITAQN